MKRIKISATLFFCAAMLSGCGNTDELMDAVKDAAESAAQTEAVSETDTTVETEIEKVTDAATEATEPEKEDEEEKQPAEISEQVLYESDIVRITFTGEDENFMGTDLKLKIENLSDKALTVSVNDTSINGVMMDTYLYADVTAGKTANEELSFYESELDASNITEIGTVEMSFEISESDSWDTLEESDIITLTLRETAAAERVEGVVVFEDKGLKITYTGMETDDIWGTSAYFEIQNDMGADISISAEDISVDGVMSDAYLYEDIKDGKYCNSELSFYDELEGTPESMELSFNVYESDSYEALLETGLITVDLN